MVGCKLWINRGCELKNLLQQLICHVGKIDPSLTHTVFPFENDFFSFRHCLNLNGMPADSSHHRMLKKFVSEWIKKVFRLSEYLESKFMKIGFFSLNDLCNRK
jgi:hypothetical protein